MVQPLAKSRPAEEIAPVSAFLLETHSKMPDYMRFSIRILTLLFDAWSYPIKGKPFHRLPLSQRIDQVAAWENSRLEFRHGLIVFYRSFATFGLYSILYGQDYEWSECRERHRSEEHTSELQSLMRTSY